MHLSEEEQSISGDISEDDAEDQTITKRKKQQNTFKNLKKIKYEDITSKSKKTKNELYKPPTVEELNELKETENLYNNNLFRLQIEELIKEVTIKRKYKSVFDAWFLAFQYVMERLPEYNIALCDIKKKNTKSAKDQDKFTATIANSQMKCDQDFVLKFVKPESVEVFGLNKLNCWPGPKLAVSLHLTMPRTCFNIKDYLNNRYFVKRYYYLAYISYFMSKHKLGGEVKWVKHYTNKMILEVKLSKNVTVEICATPTENYFKSSRFRPDVNNVKVNVFGGGNITQEPTIFYNSSLAYDVVLTANSLFIEESLSELRNVQEAVKLIYIWLGQRELNAGLGSFTGDLLLYFIVYLINKKRINKHMSSYQVIRNFWNFIEETDLTKSGISLAEDTKPETLELFQNSYSIVFLDRTGSYNVASFLDLNMYEKIKNECRIAFKLLDYGGINCFHNLFITKLPLELQFDVFLFLKGNIFESFSAKMNENDNTKYLGLSEFYVIKYIGDVLRKGFNKRASLIVPIIRDNKISFGINLDPAHAFGILEKGPALNDPLEKEFKEFWGELSTDRRFKDGSVCVALYFETETVKQRREIIKTIVNWVVSKKLNLKYQLYYDSFESLLVSQKITAAYPMGTNEEGCLKTIVAFDELGKKLRALSMPLAITSVQGISNTLNLTETFPPISSSHQCVSKVTSVMDKNLVVVEKKLGVVPRYVQPIECVLQLEHSSKWPKDLAALKNMKTAFFFEISKNLAKTHKIVSSVKPELLEVLYEGYVFRYHLFLSREIGYLKKATTANGIITYHDTPKSREMEMRFEILPKVTSGLKGLQAQFPSFGPSTALVKRWLRSHLIDNHHFPDDVINLLNASLFVNQSALEPPRTPQTGFLRFLKFFSELQWHIEPVIVDFNDELTKEAKAEIDSKLLQNRDACPDLFIATPYDEGQSLFTKATPTKEVLRRVKQLATETLTCYIKIIKEDLAGFDFKHLFVPNLDGYDVIISLKPLLNPLRHRQVIDDKLSQITLKAFNSDESTHVPVVDFNPVQLYLNELRKFYGDYANFFHDSYGGDIIGVLWIPKALEAKEFKVSHVSGRKLVNGKLVLNVDGLIEDFYTIGKGLIKSIDKR